MPREAIMIMPVPGAFELPLATMALAKTRRYACIVALGCVIRGETPHFDLIAGETASGLQLAAIETGVPVAFGVLTVREPRAGRGADRPGRRRGAKRPRDGRRLLAAPRPGGRPPRLTAASRATPLATLPRSWPESALSVARSRPSGTTGATRWWRRSDASTRISSESASFWTAARQRAYVCTRCLKAGKVEKAL